MTASWRSRTSGVFFTLSPIGTTTASASGNDRDHGIQGTNGAAADGANAGAVNAVGQATAGALEACR
jgi:hypothetical protein